jgi:hypothetical protein
MEAVRQARKALEAGKMKTVKKIVEREKQGLKWTLEGWKIFRGYINPAVM